MTTWTSDVAAREVVRCFLAPRPVTALTPHGNRGGFSGAQIWQVQSDTDCYGLKLWPDGDMTRERLGWVHGLMRQAAELAFVPRVVVAATGVTFILHGGKFWDLCTWMPGRADFCDRPTPQRIEAACIGLAQLHEVWGRAGCRAGRLPAVQRRLQRLCEWHRLVHSGWKPDFTGEDGDPVRPWAERAWGLVEPGAPRAAHLLGPWTHLALPLQPCLCDVWHDHVLLEGDQLAGLIDYGSVKIDHVAVDVARLLGTMAGDDPGLCRAGLEAYRSVRAFSPREEALAAMLDETGNLLGAANWLRWLYAERRVYEDREAVARRLAFAVRRLEHKARILT